MSLNFRDVPPSHRHPALGGHSSVPSPRPRRSPPRYRPGMSVEELSQYIKEYGEWFDEDLKIPPSRAPLVDRNQLILDQRQRRGHLERTSCESGGASVPFYMTMVGFPKHSSSTPVRKLNRISFSDMLIRRVHIGRYLLCRIVTPCTRMVAVQTVVEDPDGVAHDLSIYNFPSTFNCSLAYLDAIFSPGTVLAIREPTLKAPTQGVRPLLRVDSPTDIVFVPRTSPLLRDIHWRSGVKVVGDPTAPPTIDWQQRGNEYFKSSQWFLAAFAYSHCLATDPDALAPLLNRAEAYLRLKFYSGAIHDVQQAFSKAGVTSVLAGKALLCLSKARYGRGDYSEAQHDFSRWKCRHAGDRDDADCWIARCQARLLERQTGVYNWASLFRMAQRKIRLDVANFFGPTEVRRLERRGGGRGVVASRDLKTGELLLVTKPFASVYASDLPRNQLIVTLDLLSKTGRERTDALLLAHIVEKLYGNPDLRDDVFHLYAGPNYPSPPSSYPPPPSRVVPVDMVQPTIDIDIAQLEAICTYNNFCPFRLEAPHSDKVAKPAGLYTSASMFNHSCIANAVWYCIGDVMIVRAAQPISAGTEVTIPYCVEESYIDRQTVLRKHMLASCDCRLCEEDRCDGDARLRRRHELKARLDADAIMTAPLAEVRALEKEIGATYSSARGPIRPLSALALHVVAEKLRSSDNPHLVQESLQYDMQALVCYGFVLARDSGSASHGLPVATERVPTVTSFFEPADIMLRIACTYHNLHEEANAARWIKAALWLTDVSVGGGKDLFMMVHEETLHRMGIQSFAARVL
ncbi:hypothetical protein BD413DRAFT_475161 [Trametes elegans]|nr:hypothetical protein BD413DRAFT_475161 [Trametes elegans]